MTLSIKIRRHTQPPAIIVGPAGSGQALLVMSEADACRALLVHAELMEAVKILVEIVNADPNIFRDDTKRSAVQVGLDALAKARKETTDVPR